MKTYRVSAAQLLGAQNEIPHHHVIRIRAQKLRCAFQAQMGP